MEKLNTILILAILAIVVLSIGFIGSRSMSIASVTGAQPVDTIAKLTAEGEGAAITVTVDPAPPATVGIIFDLGSTQVTGETGQGIYVGGTGNPVCLRFRNDGVSAVNVNWFVLGPSLAQPTTMEAYVETGLNAVTNWNAPGSCLFGGDDSAVSAGLVLGAPKSMLAEDLVGSQALGGLPEDNDQDEGAIAFTVEVNSDDDVVNDPAGFTATLRLEAVEIV